MSQICFENSKTTTADDKDEHGCKEGMDAGVIAVPSGEREAFTPARSGTRKRRRFHIVHEADRWRDFQSTSATGFIPPPFGTDKIRVCFVPMLP
jgi:hypothetical protein